MTKREELKRLVVEAIHGLPYVEATFKESISSGKSINFFDKKGKHYGTPSKNIKDFDLMFGLENVSFFSPILPITIGRVMQALKKTDKPFYYNMQESYIYFQGTTFDWICEWSLIKVNNEECTDDDQTDESIERLVNIFKLNGEVTK